MQAGHRKQREGRIPRLAIALLWCAATTALAGETNDPLTGWHLSPARDVVVASIDSGVDCTHPDLAGRCVAGWDFVDNDATPFDSCYDHGTATAGVLAAIRNNDIGVAGTAEHVKIMPLRVLDCGGTSTEQRLVDAIDFAVANGADLIQAVILISPAWPEFGNRFPTLCSRIENSGILWVGPAGNLAGDLDAQLRFPPACNAPNMITVGGVDQAGEPIYNWGSVVAIRAPAIDIWTTTYGGYDQRDGTSFAAPQVAGAAARLLWMRPTMKATTLRARVLEMVDADGVLTAFRESAPVESQSVPVAAEKPGEPGRAGEPENRRRDGGGRTRVP